MRMPTINVYIGYNQLSWRIAENSKHKQKDPGYLPDWYYFGKLKVRNESPRVEGRWWFEKKGGRADDAGKKSKGENRGFQKDLRTKGELISEVSR